MEKYHEYGVGSQCFFIRNNKLTNGEIMHITINISKDKIGIVRHKTEYLVKVKGVFGNLRFMEKDIFITPELLMESLKKPLKLKK
jgi:hypothetical protein